MTPASNERRGRFVDDEGNPVEPGCVHFDEDAWVRPDPVYPSHSRRCATLDVPAVWDYYDLGDEYPGAADEIAFEVPSSPPSEAKR